MIEQIYIKNYKLFKDFKIKGFEKVNLITGSNNIGKTALLEALYIKVYSNSLETFIHSILDIYYFRYHKRKITSKEILEYFNNLKIEDIEISLNNEGLKREVTLKLNSITIKENKNLISIDPKTNKNTNFIETSIFSDETLKKHYSYAQIKDKEDFIDEMLNRFDDNILRFKFIDKIPMIKYKGINDYIHINEIGEGVKRFLFILVTLFKSENGYLFIDELENGVWYKNIDLVWEIIFKLSKELNVQIFITTHSSDVIKKFTKFNGKLFELGLNKENKIDYVDYNHKFLLEELSNEREVRGWE